MKRLGRFKVALLCTGIAASWTTNATAQVDIGSGKTEERTKRDSSAGDEIVVTAQRQEQSLSDVPISVAAYTQEMLDQRGVRSIDDIALLTPGVSLTRGDERNAGAANISIRGISSGAGSATTGVYIDDTPIQIRNIGFSAFTPFPAVFDLERVEILRGPQGTLFGAGSQGGTVRFITPKPDFDEVRFYGRSELAFTQGGASSNELGAAVSVPLINGRLAGRVSAYYRRDGGYVDRVNYMNGNMLDKNANDSETVVMQGAVSWKPSESLTITPSIFYQDIDFGDGNYFWEQLSDIGSGDFRSGNALANVSSDRFILPALAVELDLGSVVLYSNTSYFDRHQNAVNDYTIFESALFTGSPFFPEGMLAPSRVTNDQRNFTQEIRLQSDNPDAALRWVIGGFYTRNRQTASQFVEDVMLPQLFLDTYGIPFEAVFGQGLADGRYTFVLDDARSIDTQLAGFGQLDWRVTDQLTLTAGLRVSKTDFEASAKFRGPVVGPVVDDSGSSSETPITPKFGISYQPNEDHLIYASAAKGFRIGGYNPAVGVPCGVTTGAPVPGTSLGDLGLSNRPPLFESDSVWSYEVGSKNSLFGRRLNVEASAFHIDWSNMQQQVGLGCGFAFTTNLGSATSKGFDIALRARVTDSLSLGAQVGYVKTELKETIKAGPSTPLNLVTAGNDLSLHPWQVNLNGQYDFGIFDKKGYFRFDYRLQSKQTAVTPGSDPRNGGDTALPGRPTLQTLALRTGVTAGSLDVSLFVNNVFNTHKTLFRQRDTQASPLFRTITIRPRTFGITVSARY